MNDPKKPDTRVCPNCGKRVKVAVRGFERAGDWYEATLRLNVHNKPFRVWRERCPASNMALI